MQQAACGMDDLGHLGDRLNGAGFVVGQHDRHQRGRTAREAVRAQMVEIDHAGARDADRVDRFGRKPSAREHRGMLDRRHHQPL